MYQPSSKGDNNETLSSEPTKNAIGFQTTNRQDLQDQPGKPPQGRYTALKPTEPTRMPCMHPMPAWKTHAGIVTFNPVERAASKEELLIPCGTCIGCNTSKAKGWALRCLLELQDHETATFTTLTYDDQKLPPTLRRRDLQLFIKRLRKQQRTNRIRFFAAGEYGETTNRPHYHAILYGANENRDAARISEAWGQGHTKTVAVTPAAIAYTAGYTAKKIGQNYYHDKEMLNYQTGEIYEWQPPFLQMSRRPGIGASARRHTQSWRDHAILNGTPIPVPEYLHKAWEEIATNEEIEHQQHEKYLRKLTKERITKRQLEAEEQIAQAKQNLQAQRRKL